SRDWSSDVCSSDLGDVEERLTPTEIGLVGEGLATRVFDGRHDVMGGLAVDIGDADDRAFGCEMFRDSPTQPASGARDQDRLAGEAAHQGKTAHMFVIASAAKQSRASCSPLWIASSLRCSQWRKRGGGTTTLHSARTAARRSGCACIPA